MSEYQYVAFRAIDAPLSTASVAFMHTQSSRAEITPWSFDNEYHYGDFRGDASEMLRRGYDLHLHYANYGTRTLLIRLPSPLPDPRAAHAYFYADRLVLEEDKKGRGGILTIDPYYEPGELEGIWDCAELIDRLAPLRAEIIEGDLRPLYLAYLAAICDGELDPEETCEPPIPGGLATLTDAQLALVEFYEIDKSLITAAAQLSPPAPSRTDGLPQIAAWVAQQSEAKKNAWLTDLMEHSQTDVRRRLLGELRTSTAMAPWPVVKGSRTVADLYALAETIKTDAKRAAASKAADARAKALQRMRDNPEEVVTKTELLVANRTTVDYEKAAKLLADLREALAGGPQAELAAHHAQLLKAKNSTRRSLIAALRQQGFLPK